MATKVSATIKIETPKDFAKFEAPRTSQFPPKKRPTSPATISTMLSSIDDLPQVLVSV